MWEVIDDQDGVLWAMVSISGIITEKDIIN